MTSHLRTMSLRRVIAGLIAIACFVQAARLFLAPQLSTEAAASVAVSQPAPLPRYVPIPIEQIREGKIHTGKTTFYSAGRVVDARSVFGNLLDELDSF